MLLSERKKNASVLTSADRGGLCPQSGVVGDFSRLGGLPEAPRRVNQRLSQVVLRKTAGYEVFVDGALAGADAVLSDFYGDEVDNHLLASDVTWTSCSGFVEPDSGHSLPGPLSISVVVEEGRLPEKVVVRTLQESVVSGSLAERVLVSTATLKPSSSDSATFHSLVVPFPALFTQPPSVEILDVRAKKKEVASRHTTLFTNLFAFVAVEAAQAVLLETPGRVPSLLRLATAGTGSTDVRVAAAKTALLVLAQIFG